MWELLICRLCRNLFENPKILPCAHSVCEKCVEGLLLKKKKNVLQCPICDVVLKIPANGLRNIPNNFFLSEVLDILKRETNACNEGVACDACSVSVLRNLRCDDCDMMLCTKCLHAHHDSVVAPAVKNEGNALAHESEIEYARTEEGDERIQTSNGTHRASRNEISDHDHEDHQVHMPLKCKHHPKEDLRFFCNSCAQLACQDCVIVKHITHIFVSTSDAAPSTKAQLNTLINQTTIRVLYLSEALRDVKNAEEKLKSCVTDITNTIRRLGKEALTLNSDGLGTFPGEITNSSEEDMPKNDIQEKGNLDNHNTTLIPQNNSHDSNETNPTLSSQTEALLDVLKTKAKKKFEALAKHRMKLEARLGLIENYQRFTLSLILSGNDEEILLLENCVMETLGELCQNTPEVPIECSDDSFVELTWQKNQRPGAMELNGDCGNSRGGDPKIVSGEGCGSCSFATGQGLTNAVVGQDCTFTVTVKNEENKPCIEGRDSIVARIKTPNGGYFRAELIEHKLGKHKFRYRTYSAGPHVLRITLRGEEILGSPFETLSSGSTDYSRRGRLVTKFGKLGSGKGELSQPQGLAVDRLSRIFVADTGNHRIQVFDETGRFLLEFGRRGSEVGEFNEPCDVTIARTGHVLVADKLNDRLQFFTPDGTFMHEMHCGILQPTAITTDQYNNILIIDSDHSRVSVVTMSGERVRSITQGSSVSARLENVQDVACNQTGETFIISRIPAQNAGLTTKQTHASLIQVFDNNGAYIREFVTPSHTQIKPSVCRLVTDNDDRVLATGSGNKVQVFTRVGGHLTNITFTEKDCNQIDISGIALSPKEAVVVADAVNGRILVF